MAVGEDHALAGMARVHDGDGRRGDGEPTARAAREAARMEADAEADVGKAAAAQDGEDLMLAADVRR